jgi:hypothetical protein
MIHHWMTSMEAPETAVLPLIQSFILREESESLLSTGRKLNQCGRTNAWDRVDSPRSSRLWVASKRRSSSSSSV